MESSLFVILILVLGFLITLTIFSIFNYHNIKKKNKIVLFKKFGVFWDLVYEMRCLKCQNFLKNATANGNTFFCIQCNEKYFLRDDNGIPLTKNEAVIKIKELEIIT